MVPLGPKPSRMPYFIMMHPAKAFVDTLEKTIDRNKNRSLLAACLHAASALYGAIVGFRNAIYDVLPGLARRARLPVISIGGIRAGGTGKTPVAALIGGYLAARGRTVAFLSRGYGRNGRDSLIVKPGETSSWTLTGDEPRLLHDRLPRSWLGIGADRGRVAALLSFELPADSVFVLDDGFQHRSLNGTSISCASMMVSTTTASFRQDICGNRSAHSSAPRSRCSSDSGKTRPHWNSSGSG